VAAADAPRQARDALIEALAQLAYGKPFDRNVLLTRVAAVVDPANAGRVLDVGGAPLSAEMIVELIDARCERSAPWRHCQTTSTATREAASCARAKPTTS
jgi:hypothetical protein